MKNDPILAQINRNLKRMWATAEAKRIGGSIHWRLSKASKWLLLSHDDTYAACHAHAMACI